MKIVYCKQWLSTLLRARPPAVFCINSGDYQASKRTASPTIDQTLLIIFSQQYPYKYISRQVSWLVLYDISTLMGNFMSNPLTYHHHHHHHHHHQVSHHIYHRHVMWIGLNSLTSAIRPYHPTLLEGPLECIQCLHRAGICKSLLVA